MGLKTIALHKELPLRVISAAVRKESIDMIKTICQAFPALTSLDLRPTSSPNPILGDEVIQAAVQYCPMIEILPTSDWKLSHTGMLALTNTRTLKVLKLPYTTLYSANESIQSTLQSNPHLVDIDLHGPYINSALVSSIGKYCRNLKRLSLKKCLVSMHY